MLYIFISCPTSFGGTRKEKEKKLEEKEEKKGRGESGREYSGAAGAQILPLH